MDYQFRPIGRKCAATGNDLVAGEPCYSVLVEQPGELKRRDDSQAGWAGPPEGTVGAWKCIVPAPAATRIEPLDTNALMRCFERLSEEALPERDGLRYVLALLLVKKRRLRLDGSQTAGSEEFLQLSGARGEGAWEVPDLQPSDDEVQRWQRELNVYLASEWQPPPELSASAA
ncbi:MAG: hypothetical protein ACT4QC_12885 [Planctomycetaceae bacterium]